MVTAPSAERELANRLQQRDREAWAELYATYEQRLYRFSYRLAGNEHDAADLVQETFVRVLTRLDRLDPKRQDLSSYLFKTAQNLFLTGVERGRRVEPVDELPETPAALPPEDDPQLAPLLDRQQEEVRLANAALAPRQRLVLALCELEEKSYAEIGELVGLNENAVAQLISRARQSLRHQLRLVQVDRSRLPEGCQELLPQLSALLDGQLKAEKRAALLAHVTGCEHCQGALEDMEEARRRYRALIPPLVGGGALKEGIDDALARAGFWDGSGQGSVLGRLTRGGRPRRLLLVAATGAVVLAAAGGAHLALRGGEAQQAAAVEPVGAVEPAATAQALSTPVATTAPAADEVAPTVAIVSGPPEKTRARTARFEFEASEPSELRCSLDGAPQRGCSSPSTYDGLEPGRHVFAVLAVDAAGNEGAPVTHDWVILAGEADEQVAAAGTSEAATPADGNGRSDTTRPAETTPEAAASASETAPDGGRSGGDSRPAGKPDEESEPKDTTPPTITSLSGPPNPTRKTVAVFRFQASEPVSRVECSLDGGGWTRCYTPTRYDVGVGSHQFCVRAIDRANNVGPPACYPWTVEEKPPPPEPEPQPEPEPPPPPETQTGGGNTSGQTPFTPEQPSQPPNCDPQTEPNCPTAPG